MSKDREGFNWMFVAWPILIVLMVFMFFWVFMLPYLRLAEGFSPGEYVMAVPTSILAIAALVSAMIAATQVRFNKDLARATAETLRMQIEQEKRNLASIEFNKLKRKVELAEEIIGSNGANLPGPLSTGNLPKPECDQIRELAHLLDYPADGIEQGVLEVLLEVFDRVALHDGRPEIDSEQVNTSFENLRHGVYKAIPGWRKSMLEFSALASQEPDRTRRTT